MEVDEKSTYDLPDASNRERLEQEKLVQEFELKRRAKNVVVPTDDGRVREMLRQLNEPVTLFGEREVWHACCMEMHGMHGTALTVCECTTICCYVPAHCAYIPEAGLVN